ncbi:AIG2-like family protein [Necator americanus]|uniref:Gamma-glutamylcyclotransferase family protein n=1 Tax=Necator americanus TaxID=51031 RepID=W2T5J6_NECAM|nr:AIG2-like family protein [Necator americanus]ETN76466.1 AIG2-like family protein [Necator americanus]
MTINFPTRVFVYGTLKRGEPNANVISETEGKYRFIGVGRTKTPYPLVIGSKYNIPFVINEPGKGHKPTQLCTGVKFQIVMDNNTEISAWIYLLRKWRPDIYESSTPMMSSYSSKGPHGREYVSRYIRAKDMLDDSSYNLHADIQGGDPTDPITKAASDAKAVEDARNCIDQQKEIN